MPELRIIRSYAGIPDSHKIESYIERGGYQALPKALSMESDEIIDLIKKSGTQGKGRGGVPYGN